MLGPLAAAYATAAKLRRASARPQRAAAPVICVGNVVAGGAGKTPVVHALAHAAIGRGLNPAIISRGYGGTARLSTQVDPDTHTARDVGDEALLSAAIAPTWVGRDRAAAADLAVAAGADLLILDDGFQNPGLAKDFSILVFDGTRGIGNGRVIPAGPLRETLKDGLNRCDAAVIIGGSDATSLTQQLRETPTFNARFQLIDLAADHATRRVIAFAGIGNPDKFFATLRESGCTPIQTYAFPDHHTYTPDEIMRLVDAANAEKATLLTTTKDAVRLLDVERRMVTAMHVQLQWDQPEALDKMINRATAAYARVSASARR